MFSFWFTDADGNDRFEIDNILAVAGLGLGPVDISTAERGFQADGVTVKHVKNGARPFTVAWDVFDPDADEQLRALGAYFAQHKKRAFWAKRDGGEPVMLTPVFRSAAVDFDLSASPVRSLTMTFFAPEPKFRRDSGFMSVLYETAALDFPAVGLDVPTAGVEISTGSTSMRLENAGDERADTVIRFSGGVVEPYVQNTTTGEYLSVNRTVAADEVLEINSRTGRVDIIDAIGVRHNAFHYIGDTDDFIHLAVGQNALSFGAGSGSVGSMEVMTIEYFASL